MMKNETKQEISAMLGLLRNSLIRNGVSMATDREGNLMFFDTSAYINSNGKKFDGFKVNINDLVR